MKKPQKTRNSRKNTGEPTKNRFNKNRKFGKSNKKFTPHKQKEVVGTLSVSVRGTGTVFDKENKQRISIESAFQSTALHGDTVKVLLHPKRGDNWQTGEVKEIVKRGRSGIMGVVQEKDGSVIVSPIDKRISTEILVPKEDSKNATKDDLVFCRITEWTHKRHTPRGCVIEIIGKKDDHDSLMRGLALERGFSEKHEDSVNKEADAINIRGIGESDLSGRRDFRKIKTWTIDPVDAKDFDDALSLSYTKNGDLEVGVHIADVSHYVKQGNFIDEEAYERATSVYMVDRTIPMLPHILSNNLCSLMEKVDRLTMSVVFTMDKNGHVKDTWFGESVIHSQKRFTYEEAEEIIKGKEGPLKDELLILDSIAQTLRAKRVARGAILVDQREVRFVLDEKGRPKDVTERTHGRANELIEEFMILANEAVAEFVTKKDKNKSPVFMYRVHDNPNPDRITELSLFVKTLGFSLSEKKGKVDPHSIENLIKQVENTPEKDMINELVIRSMAKAIYSTKNIGHYGLALKYYCHFTSPIRRYPDLVVHRILKDVLGNKFISEKKRYQYDEIANHCSEREKDAQEAERTSIKWKQVEYMASKKGEILEGVITGIADWGIFVSDIKSKSEGVIRSRDLPQDDYVMDRFGTKLVGSKKKNIFKLGDLIKIKVKDADEEAKTIDFELA